MPCGAIVASILLVALHTDIVPCQLKQLLNSPCVTAVLVIDHRQVTQLFLPALHSAGTLHLAYTVLSLLGLGYHLEHRMGTLRFLGAIFGLTVLINVAFCLMTYIILPNFEEVAGVLAFEMPYKCFIGLTATLIAMKGVYTVTSKRSLPPEWQQNIITRPLPRNIHPVHHENRRAARAKAYDKYSDQAGAFSLDAAGRLHNRSTATFVHRGHLVDCISATGIDITAATEVAGIALAMRNPRAIFVLTDSQAAYRNFARGHSATSHSQYCNRLRPIAKCVSGNSCCGYQGTREPEAMRLVMPPPENFYTGTPPIPPQHS
ncbi:hypothetical protein HPB49_012117 [Dermacentor silvarum]|uniref:Uncharacterized protein n=1 Tax=Dermacentor silvarum TaxID=543639 RepID=A0ACB8CL21_DERSI|nr:hypothetical protein HPB49_012117 [Dermacentor silvarum]